MAIVDWLTVVGRRAAQPDDFSVNNAYQTAAEWLDESCPTFKESFGSPLDWQVVKPRAPYSHARRSDDCTRSLYVHPLATHFTFEVSGQHCQRIAPVMPAILAPWADAVSRLDIAVDMETDVTPFLFDGDCNPARINSRSRLSSSSGETVYVGSRASDRFARVYRYNPPHPRSHLLRAEFQLKHDYAKAAASDIGAGVTIASVAAAQGQHFGFQHPAWQPDALPSPLRVESHAQSGNTVRWLTLTVAPLLRRMQREGRLDVPAWFEEYVTKSP